MWSSRNTVRPTFLRRGRNVLCAVALVGTAAAVYSLGENSFPQSEVSASTATIRLQFLWNAPKDAPSLSPAQVRQHLLAEETLNGAMARLNAERDAASAAGTRTIRGGIDDLRRRLSVAVGQVRDSNQWRIAITCREGHGEQAAAVVNALARQFAEEQRTYWDTTVRQPYLAARDALDRARNEVFQAEAVLERLLDQQFGQHSSGPAAALAVGPQSLAPPAAAPLVPRGTAENSQRVELERQKAELIRRREALLVDRMPRHPAVQDAEIEIARLNDLLAKVPPDVRPAPGGSGPPAGRAPAVVDPSEAAQASRGTGLMDASGAREFQTRRAALEQAGRTYDRLAEEERIAWQRQLSIPGIELELADPRAAFGLTGVSPRMVLAALSSALCMAVGVGMIASGLGIDAPLDTMEEVRTAIPAPIVGTIPLECTAHKRGDRRGGRPLSAATLVSCGAMLVAACLIVALMFCWR